MTALKPFRLMPTTPKRNGKSHEHDSYICKQMVEDYSIIEIFHNLRAFGSFAMEESFPHLSDIFTQQWNKEPWTDARTVRLSVIWRFFPLNFRLTRSPPALAMRALQDENRYWKHARNRGKTVKEFANGIFPDTLFQSIFSLIKMLFRLLHPSGECWPMGEDWTN
jgi:hypothetical protein